MTSGFNQFGRLPLDDLNAERGYNRYLAYCHSKQVNRLFSLELPRRLSARIAGWKPAVIRRRRGFRGMRAT